MAQLMRSPVRALSMTCFKMEICLHLVLLSCNTPRGLGQSSWRDPYIIAQVPVLSWSPPTSLEQDSVGQTGTGTHCSPLGTAWLVMAQQDACWLAPPSPRAAWPMAGIALWPARTNGKRSKTWMQPWSAKACSELAWSHTGVDTKTGSSLLLTQPMVLTSVWKP